jgi:hypothetical protein
MVLAVALPRLSDIDGVQVIYVTVSMLDDDIGKGFCLFAMTCNANFIQRGENLFVL